MKPVLHELVDIFETTKIGYDWMDWEVGKKKDLSFHHIKEARFGGKYTLRNGAVLTTQAHQFLNVLDNQENKLYRELNGLFHELNGTMKPPEDDYYEELNGIYVKRLLYIPTKGKRG